MEYLENLFLSPWQLGVFTGVLTYVILARYPQRGDAAVYYEFCGFFGLAIVYRFLHYPPTPWSQAFSEARTAWFCHVVLLTATAVLYRLSPFHPLAGFPGPILARVTSFYMTYVVATGKRHTHFIALHDKYGTFVRTGPNTISINTNEAVGPIYAAGSAWNKSEAYSLGLLPGKGLFFIQDRETHNHRKRHYWASAFTNDSLMAHIPMIERWTNELIKSFITNMRPDKSTEVSTTLQRWSINITGELTFGDAYDTNILRNGDDEKMVDTTLIEIKVFEILGESPALFHIMWYLPITRAVRSMHDIAGKYMDRCRNRNYNGSALMAHWLGEKAACVQRLNDDDVKQEAVLAIHAGSNGISTAVAFALFYIALNPDIQKRLKAELRQAFPDSDGTDELDVHLLVSLPYLSVVVEESFRLGAPLGFFARVAPKGGAIIAGKYIPEDTIVGVPVWAQMTSKENFAPDPFVFRPERWLLISGDGDDEKNDDKSRHDRPGSTKLNKSAVMTFSHGPFGCLGKPLAYLEIRVALAKILLRFDLGLPPWFDPQKFLEGVLNHRSTTFKYALYLLMS